MNPANRPAPIDSIAVVLDRRGDPIRRALDELLTRSFYSSAGYVFECDPFAQSEDADVFGVLSSIRQRDREHAHVLGGLVAARGGVPATGVFPWWNLDLNYLTVPCLSRFVLGALREELPKYDALVASWPAGTALDAEARASLSAIRAEKAKQVADLEPVVAAAEKREAEQHASKIVAVKKTRDARIAKEKAAAEAAKKAKQAALAAKTAPGVAAPAAGAAAGSVAAKPAALTIGDPNEPGISRRERGRRLVLQMRQKAGKPLSLLPSAPAATAAPAAAAPAPAAAAPAAGGALLDPNEPGISPKEKARRQMMKMRGGAAPAAAPAAPPPAAAPVAPVAAAPAPAAPSLAGADLLDPNEPGISPKEKARRQIAKNRAAGGAPAPAAPAPAAAPAAAAPAPAPAAAPEAAAPAALPADLGDPNEPGIPPKEKARRQMARMRAQKG